MPVQMPARDEAVLRRRSEIVRALRAIVPDEGVISAEREMRPYESDGLTAYRQLPMVVVLPRTVDQPKKTTVGAAPASTARTKTNQVGNPVNFEAIAANGAIRARTIVRGLISGRVSLRR